MLLVLVGQWPPREATEVIDDRDLRRSEGRPSRPRLDSIGFPSGVWPFGLRLLLLRASFDVRRTSHLPGWWRLGGVLVL